MPQWLPTALVVIVAALALAGAGSPPITSAGRRWWMVSLLLCGCIAIIGTVWQEQKGPDAAVGLAGTSAPPQSPHTEPAGSVGSELTARVKILEDHVKQLERGRQARAISQDNADNFSSYLRQFGSRRVIVSCVPDDIEAYQYANQLVNIVMAGNWEVRGPQVTKIFGDVRAAGINVYVNAEDHSDTAKLLLDGFAKFQYSLPEPGHSERCHTGSRNSRALRWCKAVGASGRRHGACCSEIVASGQNLT
jgi:hypothetical protein